MKIETKKGKQKNKTKGEVKMKEKIQAARETMTENAIIEKLEEKEMTRIYKDEENNRLILSYAGMDYSEYTSISLSEFIEIVEEEDTWDAIDAEVYESALEEVGLEYGNYSDPSEMWNDFLETVK